MLGYQAHSAPFILFPEERNETIQRKIMGKYGITVGKL